MLGFFFRLITKELNLHKSHMSSIMEPFAANKKLFLGDEQTKMYAKFRPTYSEKVYETIVDFCNESPQGRGDELAVDIGCGSGQSTLPLARYYQKVIGIDVSEKQIAKAPTNIPHLSFHVSATEELPFIEDGSVDLVTTAQALHWFKLDKFYQEVKRILKPGGTFVAYGYGMMQVDHEEVHDYLMQVYKDILGDYWSPGRKHIENKFLSMALPFEGWQRNDDLTLEKQWKVDELVGYLTSWSAVQSYKNANPETDLIGSVRRKVVEICSKDGTPYKDRIFHVTWPIFLLMGHKPSSGL